MGLGNVSMELEGVSMGLVGRYRAGGVSMGLGGVSMGLGGRYGAGGVYIWGWRAYLWGWGPL